MNKIALIAKREYLQRVKTKSFILSTLLMPLLMIGLTLTPMFLMRVQTGEQKRIAVVDESGSIFPEFAEALNDKLEKGKPKFLLINTPAEGDPEAVRKTLRQKIEKNQMDAYVWIAPDAVRTGQVQYSARNVSNLMERRLLETRSTT